MILTMYGFDAAVWVVLVVIIVFEFVSFIQGNEKGKRITFIEHYCVPGTLVGIHSEQKRLNKPVTIQPTLVSMTIP